MSDNQDQSPAAALLESTGFKQFAQAARDFTSSMGISRRVAESVSKNLGFGLSLAAAALLVVTVAENVTGEPQIAVLAGVATVGALVLAEVAKLFSKAHLDQPQSSGAKATEYSL